MKTDYPSIVDDRSHTAKRLDIKLTLHVLTSFDSEQLKIIVPKLFSQALPFKFMEDFYDNDALLSVGEDLFNKVPNLI